MKKLISLAATILVLSSPLRGETDLNSALKRAQGLLNFSSPTDEDFAKLNNLESYKSMVRTFIDHDRFYDVMVRYHELVYGVGLPVDYIDELLRDDIDLRNNKIAQITCSNAGADHKLRCAWVSTTQRNSEASCPKSDEIPAAIFWYPQKIFAWVCPTVLQSCGSDLSRCFIQYDDPVVAANSELGTTEAFDTRQAVIKSLSKQPAGIAAAVVAANYPYTKILEPGITAIDGAIAHLYRQEHHFDLSKMHVPDEVLKIADQIPLTDTRFHLVLTEPDGAQAGILSSWGWLRRYEKNRTRANQLYSRFLCRQFSAELPKIFPQDPGNLRTTPGCSGCHATLDPLADFFKTWGEGGELYSDMKETVESRFGGKNGSTLADLANIIRNDTAFATCTVQKAWSWLIGRDFYADEAEIRNVLTSYFVTTSYSFKELVYAIATHPVFLNGKRSDALVTAPLSEPPLGTLPGDTNKEAPCKKTINYATDIAPKIGMCAVAGCHVTNNSQNIIPLTTENEWRVSANEVIAMISSGQMPVGASGPPLIGPVFDLKEAVRCWISQK